jgi:hypothetical protein
MGHRRGAFNKINIVKWKAGVRKLPNPVFALFELDNTEGNNCIYIGYGGLEAKYGYLKRRG